MLNEEYFRKTLREKVEFIKKQRESIRKSIDEEELRRLEEIYKRATDAWRKINKKKENKPLAIPIATDTYEMTREDNVLRKLSRLHPTV